MHFSATAAAPARATQPVPTTAPASVAGVAMLFFLPWYWGAAAFVLGYVLQYVGHLAEGNDLGEWAAIKRLLGLPYVGIAPRWNPEDPSRL